jgi:hypothetical protein
MPSAYVAKVAKDKGLSLKAVEEKWEDAKAAAEKQYGNIEKKDPSKFYAITMTIFKKMMQNEDVSMATTTLSNIGGQTNGVADPNSYIYKPKFGPMFKRFDKKKVKNLKEYVEYSLNEGTWATPSTTKKENDLKQLISKLSQGKAEKDWRTQLYHLLGTDDLFDKLDSEKEFAKKENHSEEQIQKQAAHIVKNAYEHYKSEHKK